MQRYFTYFDLNVGVINAAFYSLTLTLLVTFVILIMIKNDFFDDFLFHKYYDEYP